MKPVSAGIPPKTPINTVTINKFSGMLTIIWGIVVPKKPIKYQKNTPAANGANATITIGEDKPTVKFTAIPPITQKMIKGNPPFKY